MIRRLQRELTMITNSNVAGGAAPDLPAGWRRVSERPAGYGVGAAAANDPAGAARRKTAQDRHAGGDERHSLFAADPGCPWRYLPRDSFPSRSTVYNVFRKFQRDGVWEAIWAGLHRALRARMDREASPSAEALDSQSVKSAEKGRQRRHSGLRRRQEG
jgi:transposase